MLGDVAAEYQHSRSPCCLHLPRPQLDL